ncbi:MAG: hypothetical protein M0Q23_02455 [Syntrophales bacterium]|jgi:type IV pilus assembly protein PilQ|nr:hypothetical protein [Syntrophales bacterium]MCK9527506.1 hypothetical protein [Syntrophales bacterium]MDX9922563.1 hypothetical protein [Syntrophales bacterium]
MKRRSRIFCGLAALIGILFLLGCAGKQSPIGTPSLDRFSGDTVMGQGIDDDSSSYALLEDILFQRREGKEDIAMVFTRIPEEMNLSQLSENTIVLTLKDTVRNEGTPERYLPGELTQIREVSLQSHIDLDRPSLDIIMELADTVPCRMHRSGSTVVISFDTAARMTSSSPVSSSTIASGNLPLPSTDTIKTHLESEALRLHEEDPPEFKGERLSIVVQDTDIQNVFRLISEVSGYNIVASDLKEKVTLHMRNVPWDQALETVLEVNELGMTTRGRVITVMPLKKMEEAEGQRLAKKVAEGRVRQVSIEARIVEVNTNFSRELGIRWGAGTTTTWGGSENTKDLGILFGSSAPSLNTSMTTLPNNIGLTNSNIAVNFPSMAAATTPALGIIAGSSRWILDAKLQALEEVGDGKIISSPKVTTVDKVKATISQGEEFDVQITGADGELTTKTIRAILSLDVTPQITAEGRLSLDINAQNKYADWARAGDGGIVGPPIMTSEVQSKVIINDGDTIVIGGIYKSEDTKGGSGIPGLSKIPILGWLFKERSFRKSQMELLIFITPVILDG